MTRAFHNSITLWGDCVAFLGVGVGVDVDRIRSPKIGELRLRVFRPGTTEFYYFLRQASSLFGSHLPLMDRFGWYCGMEMVMDITISSGRVERW